MSPTQQAPGNPPEILRATRILFLALVAGVVIFSLIILAISIGAGIEPGFKGYDNIILGIALSLSLVCYLVARRTYNQGVTGAKDSLISLTGKLNQYRATLIRYMALCEGPALLGVVLFFVTGNYLMFIVTVMMIAAMIMKAPTRNRVTEELALDWKQQEELN